MGLAYVFTCDNCGATASMDTPPNEHRPFPVGWTFIRMLGVLNLNDAYVCSDACGVKLTTGAWNAVGRTKLIETPPYGPPYAPPYAGPRRWITCPECGSTDEATDTPCTNLACPSHERRGTREDERREDGLIP